MDKIPRVAILGRPNVGKSTLFNRICGRRRALVGNEPGMTRDRIYAPAEWMGKNFEVIDTGGMIPESSDLIASEIFRQAEVAIGEADHLVLVVDGRAGALPLDEELAQLLRRTSKPVALAVNKTDTLALEAQAEDFRRLGIEPVFAVSAEHGLGVGELLDHVTAGLKHSGEGLQPSGPPAGAELPFDRLTALPSSRASGIRDSPRRERSRTVSEVEGKPAAAGGEQGAGLPIRSGQVPPAATGVEKGARLPDASGEFPGGAPDEPIRVAIIGRPNVGKSTLLNRLLNQERSIVTPLPGTTRDAVDAELERDGRRYRIVDTAGIRRKGKTKLLAEKLSVIQARKHLEGADVALLILDPTEGVTALDTHIGGYAHESRRSVVIVVNKWDAVPNGASEVKTFTGVIRRRMKYLDYAPVVFVSALRGQRLGKLLAIVATVAEARSKRISAGELAAFVQAVDFDRATTPAGRPSRVSRLVQVSSAPPAFLAFTDRPGPLHFAFERFLENRLRERFVFQGTPIIIKAKASK